MEWWETGLKIGAGLVANSAIVGIPIGIAQAVKPNAPEGSEEYVKRLFKQVCIAGIAGSVASFAVGAWIRGKPGWAPTGLTQMALAGAEAVICTTGLIVGMPTLEPVRYGIAIASPGVLIARIESPKQGAKERRGGTPRIEAERAAAHYGIDPSEYYANPELYPLPERGTGLQVIS
jgi:hypothetical protein